MTERKKTKKKPKEKPKDVYYVQIKEPNTIRKDVLVSTKDVLKSLKRYERVLDIREEKQKTVQELKRAFDEILVLNKKLRSTLPKTPIPAREKEVLEPEHKHVVRAKSKLELLEHELADIERRLSSLE